MKKATVISSVLIGLLATALPAAAQRTEAQKDAMLKGFEQAFVQQIPSMCLNGFCFQDTTEALAYCQGFAQEAAKTNHFPAAAQNTLNNTLNTCTQLLQQTSKTAVCLTQERQAKAQEQGRKSLLSLLAEGNQYRGQSNYVDGYRQLGQAAAQGAQAVAQAYKDGYQNMAEGYQKVSYTDGYRQMGQLVADTYKRGYQNMAEGYQKVSYTDGYRQLWQAIKNFIKEGCRAKAKGDLILWQEYQKKHH